MAKKDAILDTIKGCCQALDDKKVMGLKVLDLKGKSSIADYFVIGTATSEPHLKALRQAAINGLREHGTRAVASDFVPGTGWIVVDGFDFMVHLFTEEQRDHYGLELLWRDAKEVKLSL